MYTCPAIQSGALAVFLNAYGIDEHNLSPVTSGTFKMSTYTKAKKANITLEKL